MDNKAIYYRVFPRIVKSEAETTITIKPLFEHSAFIEDAEYEIDYCPMELPFGINGIGSRCKRVVKPIGGVIKISLFFSGEQEHTIVLNQMNSQKKKLDLCFQIYSLEKDLFERLPFKGDFHIHSFRSDGNEAPAYVAAACRKIGLDFMAITDHHQYHPSIEAQEAFENTDIDLKIFRGEEVHPPNNPLHIVNFGGSFSVNELFKDIDRYSSEVEILQKQLDEIPENVDKYEYASAVWTYDKIRKAGGLGILCHIYWEYSSKDRKQGYYISSGLITQLFDKQPYDAYELLGGYGYVMRELDSNVLQIARYNEERIKGREIPIVGVSDAHGCNCDKLLGWYFTIVFSPSLELSDIVESVKELYSVAVETIPGESPKAYGPLRLVKYAMFLIREIFPEHDEMCYEEGKFMLDYISGDSKASSVLHILKGRTQTLMSQNFGVYESVSNSTIK